MLALGVADVQIGIITSIGMVFQIVFAFLGGAITDKLGRRKATFIFDMISWCIPALIWAVAQNFTYFLVAAIVNSVWRIPATSWHCLLVEDAEQDQLIDIYAWIHISGLMAVFFAPIAGLFIARYETIPTVRGLYVFTFFMMAVKIILLYIFSTETQQGKVRLEETKGQKMKDILKQYGGVAKQFFNSPITIMTMFIFLVRNITGMVNATFWGILATEQLKISVENIAIFPFIRSAVVLLLFFILVPKLNKISMQKPMVLGFLLFALSQFILIITPVNGYFLLIVSTVLEAFSLALLSPLLDSLMVINVDAQERARIMAMLQVALIALTSPFGWLAGVLSETNRILPFVMNVVLIIIGGILAYFISRVKTNPITTDFLNEG
jgi:MFS family permease